MIVEPNFTINNNDFQSKVSAIDWECTNADTKYLTHNLHRYSGKFIPQIARLAIELISEPGELILDPYMGSGTTLLEASLVKRNSIGVDLNPLAVLIATAKVKPISKERLDKMKEFFLEVIENFNRQLTFFQSDEVNALMEQALKDKKLSDSWYSKWFQEPVLEQLVVLFNAINAIKDTECSNLAMVAFSDILRRCSNAHSGYPNVMFDKNAPKKPLPAGLFINSLNECIHMVSKLDMKLITRYSPTTYLNDNTHLTLENESIDAIVTHPPYIGSIPYAEYGVLSLRWLGYDDKELDSKLTGGKRQSSKVIERFEAGYRAMLEESYRVLRPSRKIFLMVGDPVVKGQKVDLTHMTKNLASSVGFKLVAETTRTGVNRRANKMGNESLLFFEK